ncbi:MAG: HlyD family efflux transporter periplasmic adaptor subunit [Waterburya sp.]
MDTTIVNPNHEEELFAQAEQDWNLPVIYEQVEAAKQELFGEKQLTALQKTILRGLLCDYSPEQIAIVLPQGMHQSLVNITWNLHKCVKYLVSIESKTVESYRDIPRWLAIAGFKTQAGLDQPTVFQATVLQNPNSQPTITLKTNSINRESLSEEESKISSSPTEIKVISNEITQNNSQLQNVPVSQQNIKLSISPDSEISEIEPNYTSSALSLIDNQHQIVPPEETLALVDENDFMPPISRWTKLGGLFLAGSMGIAIALSAFTPYNINVKAQAKLRPAAGLKIVEATTEGKITEIRVTENQVVQKGDVIAVLDRSRLETKSDQLEIGIQQATLQLKQIEAQIRSQENRLSAEIERINRTVAGAKSQLNLRRREYQDRQISTNAQVSEAQANLGLAQEEFSQAQTELTSAEANLKSAQAALNSAKSKKERYQDIAVSGAISQNLLDEVILDFEQRQQDLVVQQATIQRQKQEIARRQQAIAAAQARLNNVSVAVNPSNAEVEIATENIAQEQATGQATVATLKREQESLIQQRIEIQKQLEGERKELRQLKQETQQTTISASADGILFQLKIRNPGQTVFSGKEIARIAPSNTALSIEALIPAQEIGKVKPGQRTQTKISACPYPDYGTVKGVVSKVAPDTTSPQDDNSPNPRGGAAFYKVTINPESLTLGPKNNQCSLQLGMEGQTDITTKEETVLKFLLRKARLITDF